MLNLEMEITDPRRSKTKNPERLKSGRRDKLQLVPGKSCHMKLQIQVQGFMTELIKKNKRGGVL